MAVTSSWVVTITWGMDTQTFCTDDTESHEPRGGIPATLRDTASSGPEPRLPRLPTPPRKGPAP